MANTKFEEFVKAQQGRQQSSRTFDPAARLAVWKSKVEQLYASVQDFLKPYISSGKITVKFDNITVSEELLGQYDIQQLTLKIGPQDVVFKPIAAMVIGSGDRIDVQGNAGSVKLVLVDKDATERRITIRTATEGSTLPPIPAPTPVAELVWKIATPPPKIRLVELTQDSLMDTIVEVSND